MLDPTREAWGAHFEVHQDLLEPVSGDADAAYTHEVYDLNDPRKIERRHARRLFLAAKIGLLNELDGEIDRLMRLAERLPEEKVGLSVEVVQMVKRLRGQRSTTLADLGRYAAIPPDAPTECRCGTTEMHSLHVELERQCWQPSGAASGR